ncbi:BRIX domain, putative [Plasmodium knowlesi strain H]|uniref:Ribosome production factor 2 homolog n=3 Tax=Plasmodium knowlesi TaxID=5850 RepID=A0A5K1VJ48_PLAKH|nr:ribosome biogenesis protein RPF2, putative [Plasmodium knowlesi strain H]OTN68247.1 putative BRIX domain [Plasmodium knowlesi]CAA9987178.1 ribosome biogenesis protein RPF2, putative [Plasmodium knowlesi strain H]SBO23938.1 BRIX domain, putative [Plasmodium knowlesi strain H]SBO25865.1 BRIX domain, putative [Plasmodium knowlesi strain H]VVS76652.1 ribosome biogenesis protein RPF2, putative [Plasmodium knowlesi strain H]|eukprot:XP_002261802.1 Brix domain, putative [Plasmodium knowlesi strain H]
MEEEQNKEEIIHQLEEGKAKTRKGNLILKKRKGELHESSKNCLFISSNKRTEELKNFMHDLYNLHKPFTCYMPKVHPQLADIQTKLNEVVDLCVHNNCSFFFSVFSTKKKPSRFIMGRLYNNKLFDFYVFTLLSYIPMKMFPQAKDILFDTKPIVLIQGSYFDETDVRKNIRNVLFDFFKHRNVDSVSTSSIQRLIVISALTEGTNSNQVLSFRQYLLKKEHLWHPQTSSEPLPPLEEIGPRFNFVIDNSQIANYHLFEEATKNVDQLLKKKSKKKKIKNVQVDEMGNSIKRVYVQKQSFGKLHTKHSKLHNRAKKAGRRTQPSEGKNANATSQAF